MIANPGLHTKIDLFYNIQVLSLLVKMKLLNRYRNCPLHLKETSFSRYILIMSYQKKFILAAKKNKIRNHNGVILPRLIKTTFQNISV